MLVERRFRWLHMDPPLSPLHDEDWAQIVALESAASDTASDGEAAAHGGDRVSYESFDFWWKVRI
eukprot:SAG11_NODE_5622_length_1505_cov_1.290896_3_plen_65_part_00